MSIELLEDITIIEDEAREPVPFDPARTYTAEEFDGLASKAKGYELIDGRLQEKGMGARSSRVNLASVKILDKRLDANQFLVFEAECSYQIFPGKPNRVRKPDASVVLRSQLPDGIPTGHLLVVPRLAVEVISSNDFAELVEQKLEDYFAVGVPLIWIVYPLTRTVYVHRSTDGSVRRLRAEDALTGDHVLPGFSCPVSEFFKDL